MDKLDQQIKDLKTQVTNLEKQIKNEKDKSVKATLELSLRSVNADLTQATYDKSALQAEINYNKDMLKNAVVRSPIKGTVRAIDESGTPYITIQQDGAFQVKGTLNEMSLNAGIMEGVNVTILSRIDSSAFWTGQVTQVDYANANSNEYDSMFGGDSEMSTATSYPFYVTLDNTEGLLLGQHVYIQLSAASVQDDLLRIPDGYIMDITFDDVTFQTTGTVWGVDMEKKTLIKVSVILGEYDPIYGTYAILDGITAEDYIANPADPGVKKGAAVTLRSEPEYLGQTEPSETTAPLWSEDTGDGEYQSPESGNQGNPEEDPVSNSGSQVFSTEDPETQG